MKLYKNLLFWAVIFLVIGIILRIFQNFYISSNNLDCAPQIMPSDTFGGALVVPFNCSIYSATGTAFWVLAVVVLIAWILSRLSSKKISDNQLGNGENNA
jgi:hypothetical protein